LYVAVAFSAEVPMGELYGTDVVPGVQLATGWSGAMLKGVGVPELDPVKLPLVE
jgi:hypothetical protein